MLFSSQAVANIATIFLSFHSRSISHVFSHHQRWLCIVIFLSGNPVYSMFNNEFLILLPIKRSYVVEFSTTEDNCGISGSKRYFLLENGIHKIYNGDSCVKLCCILIHFITCLYRLIVSVSFGAELRSYLKKIAAYSMNLLYIVMR